MLLRSGKYDLVFVVESWLSDTITDGMITDGTPYRIVRRDRGSRGGGILVAIKARHIFSLRSIGETTEGICLDFPFYKLNVILCYLPNGDCLQDVEPMCAFFS